MKVTITLYRVATFRTDYFPVQLIDRDQNQWECELHDRFGPMAPGFKVFVNPLKSIAGLPAMTFDLQDVRIPQAGIITADPIDPAAVSRIDGALESELSRLGIQARFENFEWRMEYRMKGN